MGFIKRLYYENFKNMNILTQFIGMATHLDVRKKLYCLGVETIETSQDSRQIFESTAKCYGIFQPKKYPSVQTSSCNLFRKKRNLTYGGKKELETSQMII